MATSPLLYRNPQGQPLVVFGTTGVAKLWAFNPADGSSGSIDTMGTEIAALTVGAPLVLAARRWQHRLCLRSIRQARGVLQHVRDPAVV